MRPLNAARSLCLLGLAALLPIHGLPSGRRVDAVPSVPFPFRAMAEALAAGPMPPVPLQFRPRTPVDADPLRDAPDPVIVPDNEARTSGAGRPPASP